MKFVILILLWVSSASGQVSKFEYSVLPSTNQKKAVVQWVWKHLPFFIETCLKNSSECSGDKETLSKIGAYLEQTESSIVFSDEVDAEISFDLADKTHRVAITELRKSANIYINSKRIDKLEIAAWVSLLIHESAHHLGYQDDNVGTLDKLGNLVALYFKSRTQATKIADFGVEESQIVSFLSEDLELKSLLQIRNQLNKAIHSQDMSSLEPLNKCPDGDSVIIKSVKSNGYKFKAVTYKNIGDAVRVVGINLTEYNCSTDSKNRKLMLELSALIKFSEDASGRRISTVDPVDFTFSAYYENDKKLEIFSRVEIESVVYNKEKVLPGDKLVVQVLVKAPRGVNLKSCRGLYNGDDYSYQVVSERLLFHEFETCSLKPLNDSENKYEVELSLYIKESFPDQKIKIDFIGFDTDSTAETALSYDRQRVEITNPYILEPIKVVAFDVPAHPKTSFKNLPFTSAYRIEKNVPFDFNLAFEGNPKILNLWLELEVYAQLGFNASGLLKVEISGSGDILTGHAEDVLPSGTRVVSLKMTMPEVYGGYKTLGFKIRKVIFQTDDSFYYEFNTPSRLELFFFTDDLENSLN